jgi:hypothetical protein
MKRIYLVLLLTIAILFVSCNQNVNQTRVMKQIDKIANNKEVAFSSNPYDYINAKKDIYDEMVSHKEILPFLISELEKANDKGNSGLREYIIAVICSDITGIGNEKTKSWSSAEEWLTLYHSKISKIS